MSDNQLISIVTPTYRRKQMLLQTIESIRRQTYQNFEIIIVDDNSPDDTQECIRSTYKDDPRIRYFRNEQNMGPGYNRNFGYRQAKGQYVIFMDDDDYYTNFSFFEEAIQAFNDHADQHLAMVASNAYDEYMESGRIEKEYVEAEGYVDGIEFLTNLDIRYNKPLSTFTALFTRDALQQADLEHMKMVNDYAIYIRALLYGNAYILPSFAGNYRKHEGNISLRIQRDFLIDNLEERKWVKERLSGRTSAGHIRRWWNVQMRLLYTYYLTHTKPSKKDADYVTKWILTNSGFNPALWAMLLVRNIKIRIKALFGIRNFRKRFKKERND